MNDNSLKITKEILNRCLGRDSLLEEDIVFDEGIFDTDKLANTILALASKGQSTLTVGELREWLRKMPADLPIVMCVDGNFGYAFNAQSCMASTWNPNAVWVVTKDNIDSVAESEFSMDEAVESGRMVPAIYLKSEKPKS